MRLSILAIIIGSFSVGAQEVNVNGVDASENSTTTIQIKKTTGDAATQTMGKGATWEVVEGTSDIEGDQATMKSEARKNWKSACKIWKSEFRNDNKENKIIDINCGSPNCAGSAGAKICSSTATYKIKTKNN